MRIIVEGPSGYPVGEARRVVKKIIKTLEEHREHIGSAALVNADEPHEDFAYAGAIWVFEARVASE